MLLPSFAQEPLGAGVVRSDATWEAFMVLVERAEHCPAKSVAAAVVRLFAVRFAEGGFGVVELNTQRL